MKIAICFFGITRSLTHTIKSIEANVLTPAQSYGEVEVYCHFFQQDFIDSARTGEYGALEKNEYKLLTPDSILLEDPSPLLISEEFERIRSYGDHYNNGFHSLNNLLLQLSSLRSVTNLALTSHPDVYIFARPDLFYHDSFQNGFSKRRQKTKALLPDWGHAMGGITKNGRALIGVNDRFSICFGCPSAMAYGKRIDKAEEFCRLFEHGLHAESLLRFAMEREKVDMRFVPLRASRVRFGGEVYKENFDGNWRRKRTKAFVKQVKFRLKNMAGNFRF